MQNENEPQKVPKNDLLEAVEGTIREVHASIQDTSRSVFERYPLTFALLGTFGIAAMIYGFEGLIGSVPILENNPVIVFFLGLVLLLGTGSLYRLLQR